MGREAITAFQVFKHGYHEAGISREIRLDRGTVYNAFRVFGGPVRILCMFCEITQAVADAACNMSFKVDSAAGGSARVIGDTVNIQAAAAGDFFVSEGDGTNLIKVTTATGLIHGYFYAAATAAGTIVPEGNIDVVLSAAVLASGKGRVFIWYKPLVYNACIATDNSLALSTSTTSTSTSTSSSTTSSSSSTTSTSTSTSSTTSSTASTTSSSSTTTTTTTTSSTTTAGGG